MLHGQRRHGTMSATVFRDGWNAALAGKPQTANPYLSATEAWLAWRDGWKDAMAERDKDQS